MRRFERCDAGSIPAPAAAKTLTSPALFGILHSSFCCEIAQVEVGLKFKFKLELEMEMEVEMEVALNEIGKPSGWMRALS